MLRTHGCAPWLITRRLLVSGAGAVPAACPGGGGGGAGAGWPVAPAWQACAGSDGHSGEAVAVQAAGRRPFRPRVCGALAPRQPLVRTSSSVHKLDAGARGAGKRKRRWGEFRRHPAELGQAPEPRPCRWVGSAVDGAGGIWGERGSQRHLSPRPLRRRAPVRSSASRSRPLLPTCWCALRILQTSHLLQNKANAHWQRLGGPQAVKPRPRFLEPHSLCAPLLLSLASSIASACAINVANAPC